MTRRRGFALITVLWALVVTAAITAAGAAAGRDAAAGLRNRINATRAYWRANGCAERARFAADRILAEASVDVRDSLWRAMDLGISNSASVEGCTLRIRAAGSSLDVNSASAAQLERLFDVAGLEQPQALAAALLDWTDADDEPRDMGAESVTYAEQGRRNPRNGPIADAGELRYVKGFEHLAIDSLLGADSARISIANAPLAVLASLPGFSAEVLARIAECRSAAQQITSLLSLENGVSQGASDALIASFPELTRKATVDPESWRVVAVESSGSPGIASTVELTLVRAQARAAVVRRRVW